MRQTAIVKSTIIGLGLLLASSAHAVLITFDGLPGSNGDALGTYMEDGFSVTDVTGTWNQGFAFGGPVPSIFTDSNSANTVEVTKTGGGLFSLNSVDFACNIGSPTAAACGITLRGLLGGIEQFAVIDPIPGAFVTFETFSPPGSGILIDILELSIGVDDSNIDNIDVEMAAVLEPTTLALMGLGLAGLGYNRKTKTA